MKWRDTLRRWGLPLVAGVWVGLCISAVERSLTTNQLGGAIAGDPAPELPAVDAGNDWGQHTPRASVVTQLPGGMGLEQGRLRANVETEFNPDVESPRVDKTAYLDPMSSVIGDVEIGGGVFVAPFASLRGDQGQPIYIGNDSNVQDGVVIHGLKTFSKGKPILENMYAVRGDNYSVHIGDRVSLAQQSQVFGPAWIEDDVFVGMQAFVFKSHIEPGVVVEPGASVIGVTVPAGRYVPAHAVVTTQDVANRLPEITFSYGLRDINKATVHVNRSLAIGYSGGVPASHTR